MSRIYLHRYKVLSGPMTGLVNDGIMIGNQDYPDQFTKENMTHQQIQAFVTDKWNRGLVNGIWLNEAKEALYLPRPIQGVSRPKVEVTDEGVNYDDIYMDLCVPFDRYGNEVRVGDNVIFASKNEARRGEVTKISKSPWMYGSQGYRKLTIRDEVEHQTLTINYPHATIRV